MLVDQVQVLQRYWRGAISRQWVRDTHKAATFIQKFVRTLLVEVALDKPGRDVVRKCQKEMNVLLKSKDSRSESEHIARCSVVAGHARVAMEKQRNRNVDMRRALSFNLRSKHTRKQDRVKMLRNVGRTQPQRLSVFEPTVFAIKRLEPPLPARIGCKQSHILMQVENSKRLLNRSLPPEPTEKVKSGSWVCPFRPTDPQTGKSGNICKMVNWGKRNCSNCGKRQYEIPHGATLRGRAAVIAMRLAKTTKMSDPKTPLLNINMCGSWGSIMFEPKGF